MTTQTTTTDAARTFTDEADFLEKAQVGDTFTDTNKHVKKTRTVLAILTPDDPGYREDHRTLRCQSITTGHLGRPHYTYRSRVTRHDNLALGPVTVHGGRFITHDLSGALSTSVRLPDMAAPRFSAKGLDTAHAQAVDFQRTREDLGLTD